MHSVITEITPLSEKDCFYLVDRNKKTFDYPLHRHADLELNFVSNCSGARRVVGDSMEKLGDYDLALIGCGLEHCWEHAECDHSDKREITIQFSASLLSDELLGKNPMKTIHNLLKRSANGVAFGMMTIMRLYSRLDDLTKEQPSFLRLLNFLEILYHLSNSEDSRQLATTSFSNTSVTSDSRRVMKVEEEINRRYSDKLTLEELASIAGMTPTAFSRFFKRRTGRTLSEYIIDIRLGHAARQLVDTTMTIAEICYDSGFTNLSNFNRAFKRKKGCSPRTFRDNYLKTKLLV
ncbi:MAG: AraC family transcriptional regulator [Muribaculaceae bacterium]|nr:AraC family transcriptional regulator [Muribaculaceae bacterium]